MYAIISDGSRQYKVEEGQELVVDYRDVPAGQQVTFEIQQTPKGPAAANVTPV